jgi:Carboxypeptidase regulatory-like domain/TonB-dependent Receptor Plug Domain
MALSYTGSQRRASLAGIECANLQPTPSSNTRPNRSLAKLCLVLTAMLVIACVPVTAQVIFGSIIGTVTDQSGGAVPGAMIKIASRATNEARTTSTGSNGTYSFPNLPPGQYRVEVQQDGFKQFVRSSVEVQVDVTSRVDVSLEVGNVAESVVVTGESPLLQTDSSSLGTVVSQAAIQNIPLSGRNINNLLTLVPGVVAGGGTYGNAVSNQAGGARTNAIGFGNYAIGGGFGNQSQFYVDGVPSNAPANNLNSYIPSQDVVQEFRVVTNNISAEYGNYAGGVINLSTKSGSNKFHGAAYEYLRNKVLNANGFFANRQGLSRPPLVQNQFGATFGGPIRKDKTFFFFGYEREVVHTSTLSQSTVPTAAMRAGDFSAPGLAPIYDQSQPGNPQFSCGGVLNVICPGRLDATALKLFAKEFPLPNRPGLVNNFVVNEATGGVNNQISPRVDHHFSDKNSMFARYGQWSAQSNAYDAWGLGTAGQGQTGVFTKTAIVGDTHSFNSSTSLDVRLAFLRVYEDEFPDSSGVDLSQFGPNWSGVAAQLPRPANWPNMGFNGNAGVSAVTGTSGTGSQLYWHQNVYTLSANLSKIVGRHQLKFGSMVRRVQWISDPANGGPTLTFDPIATATSQGGNVVGGSSVASALLGIPLSVNTTYIGGSRAYYTSYGFFVDDTFQATRKLTLTLGLRWDQPSSFSEARNSDTVFLPDQPSPLGSFLNPVTGQQQKIMGNMAVVGTPDWKSQREDVMRWRVFSPRLGLAYRLTDKTVLRGGYGISYPPTTLSQDGPNLSPVNSAGTVVNNTFQIQSGSPSSILATVSNPMPFGISQPPRHNADPGFFYGKLMVGRKPGYPLPYVQQWNVALEQQIGKDSALTVAYAGSKGTNLLLQGLFTVSQLNLNQIPDQYLSMGSAALLAPVKNPFFGIITNPGTLMSQPTVAAGLLLRPFPQFDRVLALDPYAGKSNYKSLQVSYQKRFGAAGILTVAYTWSKLEANTDSVTSFLDENSPFSGQVQDNNHLDRAYSLSGYDIPHNLSVGYGIELPFGRGKHFRGGATGAGNAIISGWRVNGITTLRSGNPLGMAQVRAGTALSQVGGGGGFFGQQGVFMQPDAIANCDRGASGSRQFKIDHGWFNTNCFTAVPSSDVRFGNAQRIDPNVRIDALKNWDFSIAKRTAITELLTVQFTAESYNTFNRVRFGAPNNTVGNPLFGLVTGQSNQPRAIQFGLRLDF